MNQNRTKRGPTRAYSNATLFGPSPMHCADALRRTSHLLSLRRRAPQGPVPLPRTAQSHAARVRNVRPAEPTSEKIRGGPAFPRPDCSLSRVPVGTPSTKRVPGTHASSRKHPRPAWHGPTCPHHPQDLTRFLPQPINAKPDSRAEASCCKQALS